ncbi:hypothetical protein BSKO_14078 [Bryopsis sp. KO-2023]|nr:hypothetical protein BSKO_14078 [Bryopsis sp. KO-2023]
MDSAVARTRWEMENNVQSLTDNDSMFRYNAAEEAAVRRRRPWQADPNYFKHTRMSALALLKIAMHARSGGSLEVMGLLQGKIVNDTFVVVDSFPLPVEGTETRVNVMDEANIYMFDYLEKSQKLGMKENVIGWYHSHPGYGCWLSGIDVTTQMINQQGQDPWLAIVIDPVRTMASGKVEIGAFRTYPEGFKPPEEGPSEYQTIPLSKIEDFGVHASQYYTLDISYFKSSVDSHLLDLLWSKYWLNTLSSSPLISNRDFISGQISDVAEKIEQAENQVQHKMGRFLGGEKKTEESQLSRICQDTTKMAVEQIKGLSGQVIKDLLFNFQPGKCCLPEKDTQAMDISE